MKCLYSIRCLPWKIHCLCTLFTKIFSLAEEHFYLFLKTIKIIESFDFAFFKNRVFSKEINFGVTIV